jgi:chromosome segregation ATPase
VSGVSTRKPRGGAQSEEELLEQWDFLDQLVARQAALLKAGVQDSEELDDPQPDLTEVEALRRQLEELEAKLGAAEEAGAAAQAALHRMGDQRDRLHRQLASLTAETAGLHHQLAALEAELQELRERHRAELSELARQHGDSAAERHRWERERDATMEALRAAELEVARLRERSRRGFWPFRGRN